MRRDNQSKDKTSCFVVRDDVFLTVVDNFFFDNIWRIRLFILSLHSCKE